jgi:hypothetical protein
MTTSCYPPTGVDFYAPEQRAASLDRFPRCSQQLIVVAQAFWRIAAHHEQPIKIV